MRRNGSHITAGKIAPPADNSEKRRRFAANTAPPSPGNDGQCRQFGSWPALCRVNTLQARLTSARRPHEVAGGPIYRERAFPIPFRPAAHNIRGVTAAASTMTPDT